MISYLFDSVVFVQKQEELSVGMLAIACGGFVWE